MAEQLGELMMVKINSDDGFNHETNFDRRRIAFSIRGKHYADVQELEAELGKNGIDSEDFDVFTLDELCNDLDDGEYPTETWTTHVHLG